MENTQRIEFNKMFALNDEDGLEGVYIERVTIDTERRKMEVQMSDTADPKRMSALQDRIARDFKLSSVKLIPKIVTVPAPEGEACKAGTDAADLAVEDSSAEEEDIFARTRRLREEKLRGIKLSMPVKKASPGKKSQGARLMGRGVSGSITPMSELELDSARVTVCGHVFAVDHRDLAKRKAWIISFDMTDYTGSVRIRKYITDEEEGKRLSSSITEGMYLKVAGVLDMSNFDGELELKPSSIETTEPETRMDCSEEKRVELHLHTRFSRLDALTDPGEAIKLAAAWRHPAIAITDHGVAQAFPDAASAGKKHGIKILYGCEAYYTNNVDDRVVVQGIAGDRPLSKTFVAFDLETTGLSSRADRITEIGAVRYVDGQAADTLQMFVDPEMHIPEEVTRLTGITDDDVRGQASEAEAVARFMQFIGNDVLVAHNADFDLSFVAAACSRQGIAFDPVAIDTLILAQNLMPELKSHKLNNVASALGLPEFRHHRASDDAETTARIASKLLGGLDGEGMTRLTELNAYMLGLRSNDNVRRRARHIIVLAKNRTGLKNLYKLISLSHLEHYKRNPIVPKNELIEHREGLIIGSACENGELFSGLVSGRSRRELLRIASFYDYLEIQPICNNRFLIRDGKVRDDEALRELNREIVRLGDELGKPVVATGDVHFLEPEHEIYRRILLAAQQYPDADSELPIYFKTTEEMLEEFAYLGEDKAREAVITNPKLIADMCEEMSPLPPKQLFVPKIENSAESLREIVHGKMRELYGEVPPALVAERVSVELGDILDRGYDVIYMSAQMLVRDSMNAGYLVGSRGSVGSSIVAYLAGITEVNSLPAHYRCPECRHSDFESGHGYGCGADMPDLNCPVCGTKYIKDGFDIPFATFLGFGGDKIPDIDLNFSGERQAQAHKFTIDLFGEDHVFRAGTISTLKDKTAFGYAKKYLEERGMSASKAELNRLTSGCVGVKRTTGQHPGGLVVVPQDMEVTDFCPVQHPADDVNSGTITTHFEYHCMEDNLLKLDILGHDDPTMVKRLGDLTGVDPQSIPLDDPDTLDIFSSPRRLGMEGDDPIIGKTGTLAVPEFGTKLTREMLNDTQPKLVDTLVRLSGFSHGTDVWHGNAKDLILSGTCTVNEAIGCRDDIMLYLIEKGMDDHKAFKIMESVRKGRGLTEEWESDMAALGVPRWYINSCNKIKYMFPKAHAVAYVMMGLRIGWYKVHYPKEFYCAYFSIRAKDFDAAIMMGGLEAVRAKIREIEEKKDASPAETDMLTTLEVCYEFNKRGFVFDSINLFESDAVDFTITEHGLRPPFTAVAGLGETAAYDLVAHRHDREFVSVEDLAVSCPKVSKTHIAELKALGAFGSLPETSQLSLFDF